MIRSKTIQRHNKDELYCIVQLAFSRMGSSLPKWCIKNGVSVEDATDALKDNITHLGSKKEAALREKIYNDSNAAYYDVKINVINGGYMRLCDVLRLLPVSRSTWYQGVKKGIYPAPIKVGTFASVYRSEEIMRTMRKISLTVVK